MFPLSLHLMPEQPRLPSLSLSLSCTNNRVSPLSLSLRYRPCFPFSYVRKRVLPYSPSSLSISLAPSQFCVCRADDESEGWRTSRGYHGNAPCASDVPTPYPPPPQRSPLSLSHQRVRERGGMCALPVHRMIHFMPTRRFRRQRELHERLMHALRRQIQTGNISSRGPWPFARARESVFVGVIFAPLRERAASL